MNETLFGKKIIATINSDEQELLRNILFLYAKGKQIDCDPTYSDGTFYKNGLQEPTHKFDKYPVSSDVIEANSMNLPLKDKSCNIIMFDPPFIMGWNKDQRKKGGIMGNKFTAFHSWEELKEMYSFSLREFHRVLRKNGIVIFKCQDCNFNSRQYFTHSWVINEAMMLGFYVKDLFILVAKQRMMNGGKQHSARKFHSYFLVLEKANRNRKLRF